MKTTGFGLLLAAFSAAGTLFTTLPALAESKGLVAFSQAEMNNEWRVMDTKEMEKAWRDAGYDFAWTNANSDPAKQLADVEDLLSRKPAVLIVAPIEYEALAPVPGLAAKANIPLIVVDRALPGKAGANGWISVLTTDFVDSGIQVANDVVAQLTKKNGSAKGTVLHVTGNVGASPVIDEQKGIEQVFAKAPGVKIAASCDSGNSREGGRKCMEDLLQAFPAGSVDAVIFDNDDAAIGGLAAINAANRTELKGWLWGKDGTVDGLKAIVNGDIVMSVQTPPFFGAPSVKAFEDFKAGKKVEPLSFVPKETFDLHTPGHVERAKKRIEELRAMGVGCC
ncbi:MAG: substrate-binding domain-containing protein [Ancalomicrobiaceae bacterium]|nr:substrate-binding domain-containing protein [Ancalomicrobiaceae bacterium]